MVQLLDAALAPSSRQTYAKAISSFISFCSTHSPNIPQFPASAANLASYITQMYSDGFAPTTMLSHLSALSYVHKLTGTPDHTQHFAIKKLITGAQKLDGRLDMRLPITPAVLGKLVHAVQFIAASEYLRLMLRSMFLLAFHAFLRIGEITVHGRNRRDTVVQLKDLTISSSELTLSMSHFKHNTSLRPVILSVSATHGQCCPVRALCRFMLVRGQVEGPLFAFADASPVWD